MHQLSEHILVTASKVHHQGEAGGRRGIGKAGEGPREEFHRQTSRRVEDTWWTPGQRQGDSKEAAAPCLAKTEDGGTG